jgi:polyhydroxyalkanoate synthesis regulator phasin
MNELSNTLEGREAQTPEEIIESLKRRLAVLEDTHRMEEIKIRLHLVAQIVASSFAGAEIDAEKVIARAEALAQYILNGKPAEPMLVVSDSPMVPLEDITNSIKSLGEKVKELLADGKLSEEGAKGSLDVLTSLAQRFSPSTINWLNGKMEGENTLEYREGSQDALRDIAGESRE